nr:hydrogenase maturation protease [Bacteroidota bacterium]
MNNKTTLIYGIGNEILSDDAIGPKLTWQLEKDLNLPNIKFETAFVGGLEVLEIINGYDTVVFIDAIKT